MTEHQPTWERQVKLFVALAMVNGLFVCCVLPPSGGNWLADGLIWVLAFPHRLTKELAPANPLVFPLLLLNPFLYGSMWWLAWRLFVLMRRKQEE